MVHLNQQVLRTDLAGMPIEWVDYRDAARLYFLDQVAYIARLTRGAIACWVERRIVDLRTL